jgi:undecaprenyl-diphosphatase
MIELIAGIDSLDQALFQFINQTLANPVTDFFMPLLTADLHLKIFYALCLLLILWKGDRRLRFAVIFSLIVVIITDQLSSSLLKPLFARPRPCHDMVVHLLVKCGKGFSLPSSHAANLFGQAFFFHIVQRSYSKYLIPLAILVALSRVFVGVHYPFDILTGAALGTLIGYGIGTIFVKSRKVLSFSSDAYRPKKQENPR